MNHPDSLTLPERVLPVKKLARGFYARSAHVVAIDLIGKVLVFETNSTIFQGRIVETEAYGGSDDPASHAYRGQTPRNQVMFGRPGMSYVYFTYGNHHCFNAVTESEGSAGAVLIRALEPIEGIELMKKNRGVSDHHQLTSGPGKLTQAFGITRDQNNLDLTSGNLYIDDKDVSDWIRIGVSARIGISAGKDRLLRFFEEDNPHVSTARKSARKVTEEQYALR